MSGFISTAFSNEMVKGLERNIAHSTIETIDQIFGYKLTLSNESSGFYNADVILANVEFWENFETFYICFIFEKDLIYSLVGSIYEDESASAEKINEICTDACERRCKSSPLRR